MFTQLPHLSVMRPLAVLAVALTFGLSLYVAGGTANPANADASQWTRSSSNWGNSTGWNQHWRSQTHNQFNGTQVIVGGGSGVIVTRPAFVTGGSGFVVNQGHFIVNQGHFIVGQPAFVQRPNFVFERSSFARKQWQFVKRHPSLRLGNPWWRNNWSHKRWKHKRHQMGGGMHWGGMN